MAEPDLEQVIVKTLFWDLYPFGCLFKWEPVVFWIDFLVEWPTVIFSPFKHLIDNMPDSPLLCPSAFTSFCHLINSSFFSVLSVAKGILESHQSVNHRNTEIFGFNSNKVSIFKILGSDFDILIDGINTAVHEDTGLVEIKVDLFVYEEIDWDVYFRGKSSFGFWVQAEVSWGWLSCWCRVSSRQGTCLCRGLRLVIILFSLVGPLSLSLRLIWSYLGWFLICRLRMHFID